MNELSILVTGASGFIGSYAVPLLSQKFKTSTISLITNDVDKISLQGYDVVLHLAGIAHQMKEMSEDYYEKVNCKLTTDLATKAKNSGVSHFIFLSSVKVYGEYTDEAVHEFSPCYPADAYARSKFHAENEIMKLISDSFTVTVVRPTLVYGKNVKGNLVRLIELVMKYPLIPLGGIDNKRSMVFVGNLLALIERIIEKRKSGVFIACDVNDLSTSTLIATIATQLNLKRKLIRIPKAMKMLIKRIYPSGYNRLFGSFIVDSSRTNQVLDFTPPFSFEDGIQHMLK